MGQESDLPSKILGVGNHSTDLWLGVYHGVGAVRQRPTPDVRLLNISVNPGKVSQIAGYRKKVSKTSQLIGWCTFNWKAFQCDPDFISIQKAVKPLLICRREGKQFSDLVSKNPAGGSDLGGKNSGLRSRQVRPQELGIVSLTV